MVIFWLLPHHQTLSLFILHIRAHTRAPDRGLFTALRQPHIGREGMRGTPRRDYEMPPKWY